MPGGRKPKYKPEMCKVVTKALADGYSKEAAAGILKIGKRTLYDWADKYPQFSQAIEDGEALSQQWWEDKGRQACTDGEFNATVWSMNMKNRFGWTDKTQTDMNVKGDLLNAIISAQKD